MRRWAMGSLLSQKPSMRKAVRACGDAEIDDSAVVAQPKNLGGLTIFVRERANFVVGQENPQSSLKNNSSGKALRPCGNAQMNN